MVAGGESIGECLASIDKSLPAALAGCMDLEEEWTTIKKTFHKRILEVHPDKGGDAVTFREVRSAFEVLRALKDAKAVPSFQGTDAGSFGSTKSAFASTYNYFSTGPVPSWEFYSEAADEAVPTYRVELAKSGRSKCSLPKTSGAIKHGGDPVIDKNAVRIGWMDLSAGSYSRWVHLACWRVPSKIWRGLPDQHASAAPDSKSTALLSTNAVEEALRKMNEVLLCGFSELPQQERQMFVQHVLNKDNWAAIQNRKPKIAAPVSDSLTAHSGYSQGYGGAPKPAGEASSAMVPQGHHQPRGKLAFPKPGKDAPAHSLAGKTVVMTGVFPEAGGGAGLNLGKEKVKAFVESFGGRVTGSMSGKTDILLVGKEPGMSKVSKARAQPGKTAMVALHDIVSHVVTGSLHLLSPGEAPQMVIDNFSGGYAGRGGVGNGLANGASAKELAIASGRAPAPLSAPPAKKARVAKKAKVESEDSDDAEMLWLQSLKAKKEGGEAKEPREKKPRASKAVKPKVEVKDDSDDDEPLIPV